MNQSEIDELLEQSIDVQNAHDQLYPSEHYTQEIIASSKYSLANSEQLNQQIVDEIDEISSVNFENKDEDMSEAKSQFIQSSRLNINKDEKNKNKINQIPKEKVSFQKNKNNKINKNKEEIIYQKQIKDKQKIQSVNKNKKQDLNKTVKQPIVIIKPKEKVIKQKIKKDAKQQKNQKPSRTNDQITAVLKRIHQQQKLSEQRLKQKKNKQMEKLKQQYDQALKQQQLKKQKNKKIFQEQKNKKLSQQKKNKKKQSIINKQFNYQQQQGDQAMAPQPVKNDPLKIQTPVIKNDVIKSAVSQVAAQSVKKQQKKINRNKLTQAQINRMIKANHEKQSKKIKEPGVIDKRIQHLQNKKLKLDKMQQEKLFAWKEEDTHLIKTLKQQIRNLQTQNKLSNKQIYSLQSTIANLNKIIKDRENKLYPLLQKKQTQFQNLQTTPLELMLRKYNTNSAEGMFRQIDVNNDQFLSKEELKNQYIGDILDQIDKNKDGLISMGEFIEAVQRERKKQMEYFQIVGDMSLSPIDIEAKILDMKAKIKFIKENNLQKTNNKYQKKIQKIQKMIEVQKQTPIITKENSNNIKLNNQIQMLENECQTQTELLKTYREIFKENLKKKNFILGAKVTQNLKLKEQLYLLKNQLQQWEIIQISKHKINQNKKGYEQRKSQMQKQNEENYRKNMEYQLSITNPTKILKNTTFTQQVKFLAAVILIQRNYRQKKAYEKRIKNKAL